MALILHIDTSTELASLCLTEGEQSLMFLSNKEQRDHASWLHPAIEEAFRITGTSLSQLQAVGITSGPGSYTGLRVAMAAAKGLCYTLKIPLITVNTLEAMVSAAAFLPVADYFCPMIDARRMEVFTALYDKSLKPLIAPTAMILTPESFIDYLEKGDVVFFGNGQPKFSTLLHHPNAVFSDFSFNASNLNSIINKKYNLTDFADLTYQEPDYLKDFHSSTVMKAKNF